MGTNTRIANKIYNLVSNGLGGRVYGVYASWATGAIAIWLLKQLYCQSYRAGFKFKSCHNRSPHRFKDCQTLLQQYFAASNLYAGISLERQEFMPTIREQIPL